MKKIIHLLFTLVIFFNLIFVPDTFAFYSCEEKATDLVKIQSEIDGLNAQKTTLENWLTNLKNWVDIQVGKRANEKSAAKNLEGKGSARYKDEIAELQTQIDEIQTKINELQASYSDLLSRYCSAITIINVTEVWQSHAYWTWEHSSGYTIYWTGNLGWIDDTAYFKTLCDGKMSCFIDTPLVGGIQCSNDQNGWIFGCYQHYYTIVEYSCGNETKRAESNKTDAMWGGDTDITIFCRE